MKNALPNFPRKEKVTRDSVIQAIHNGGGEGSQREVVGGSKLPRQLKEKKCLPPEKVLEGDISERPRILLKASFHGLKCTFASRFNCPCDPHRFSVAALKICKLTSFC